MKEDKEIEKLLLNDEAYEKFVNAKIEKEFEKELDNLGIKKEKFITDFKLVPREKLFSKQATYIVMNKKSKTKSFINGMQAESFLGSENSIREKFVSGQTDSFVSGDNFVKFYKLKV
ncbi:hypothetical protein HDR58_05035 [bacterium]|nr:hypothetical protein [bacterium]